MLTFLRLSCRTQVGRSALVGRFSSVAELAQEQKPDINEDSKSEGGSTGSGGPKDPNGGSTEQKPTGYLNEQEAAFTPFRYVYPEFLPDPRIEFRNKIREKLERMDMLKRRSHIEIPEFYVGSIMSVTVSDKNAPGKTTTFVGICTEREGNGLRATFTLRNHVDGHGMEICYDLYNPTILNITCLRLEKRLDENLRYLRDAPPEYSTIPFDMTPEMRNPDAPVPINPIKVRLNPKPWCAKWQYWNLKGIEDISYTLNAKRLRKMENWKVCTGFDTIKYDLMNTYRKSIPADYQTEIYSEVSQQLASLTASLRKQKKKRSFAKPQKIV